jgi:aryl-alcohol dehydrogenase-like predicted oxidoreductase
VRSGKVRYIGTSKFPAWKIVEGLWISEKLHLNRFVTEQPRYNMLMREIEDEVVPMAREHGIALLPYSPLAGGILTGKYKMGQAISPESRMADEAWGEWAKGFMVRNTHQKVEALSGISTEKSCTLSQLALAWAMHQPAITSVIIGPRTMKQYEDNRGALEVNITDEDRQRIDEIVLGD